MCGTGFLALSGKADIKVPEDNKKHSLLMCLSSDRGLCGATRSLVARQAKVRWPSSQQPGKKSEIVGTGDKIRGIFHRTHSDQFSVTFQEVGRKPPTSGGASFIALELLNSGYEFDEGSIIFNQFRSVIS